MTQSRQWIGRFIQTAGSIAIFGIAFFGGSVGLDLIATASLFAGSFAQEKSPPPDSNHRTMTRGDFRIDFNDPPEKLAPIRPRTPDDQKRLDAMSWYLKGRFLEQREEFKGALEAY